MSDEAKDRANANQVWFDRLRGPDPFTPVAISSCVNPAIVSVECDSVWLSQNRDCAEDIDPEEKCEECGVDGIETVIVEREEIDSLIAALQSAKDYLNSPHMCQRRAAEQAVVKHTLEQMRNDRRET